MVEAFVAVLGAGRVGDGILPPGFICASRTAWAGGRKLAGQGPGLYRGHSQAVAQRRGRCWNIVKNIPGVFRWGTVGWSGSRARIFPSSIATCYWRERGRTRYIVGLLESQATTSTFPLPLSFCACGYLHEVSHPAMQLE
jgi:hypothetical protein